VVEEEDSEEKEGTVEISLPLPLLAALRLAAGVWFWVLDIFDSGVINKNNKSNDFLIKKVSSKLFILESLGQN
jgi:hypothetical protein